MNKHFYINFLYVHFLFAYKFHKFAYNLQNNLQNKCSIYEITLKFKENHCVK